mgnify:CR=1 FL=1
MIKLAAVVAMGSNRCIGIDNKLPWYLPEDLKHFKAVTLGKPVIMGRKTFESIGKPLPGRTNIVITRSGDWSAPGCRVVPSIERGIAMGKAQAELDGVDEAMVIGGAQIYAATLDQLDRLYLTEVDTAPAGDAFFPALSDDWQQIDERAVASVDGRPGYRFLTLGR